MNQIFKAQSMSKLWPKGPKGRPGGRTYGWSGRGMVARGGPNLVLRVSALKIMPPLENRSDPPLNTNRSFHKL